MKRSLIAFLSCLAVTAHAQTIEVVWPFALGSAQGNMIRGLVQAANDQQSKYTFLFVNKPGAGGTVAALSVLNAQQQRPNLTVLASSSSFYIRPYLYKESHSSDNFSMLSRVCAGQPLAIYSKKIDKLTDNTAITVGINAGSITSLVTRTLMRANPSLKITEVSYKDTPSATTDMLGQHIDGAVEFLGKSVLSRFDSSVHVLGATGRWAFEYPTFAQLGYPGLENLTSDFYILTPQGFDAHRAEELNAIFDKAKTDVRSAGFCTEDYGTVPVLKYADSVKFHYQEQAKWNRLTNGMARE